MTGLYRIYSQSGCIYCDAAMDLLDKQQIQYEEVKIDKNDDEKTFLKSQGFRTVPQIYNELGEHIGGFSDLQEYFETGKNLIWKVFTF